MGAVQLPVSMIKAGGCEEEGFIRHKRIDADMMRCLQSAPTFHRSDSVRRLARREEAEGDISRPEIHSPRLALGEPLVGTPRGKISTRSEMEQGDPLAKSRAG